MGQYPLREHECRKCVIHYEGIYLWCKAEVAAQKTAHKTFVGEVVYSSVFTVSAKSRNIYYGKCTGMPLFNIACFYFSKYIFWQAETDETIDSYGGIVLNQLCRFPGADEFY